MNHLLRTASVGVKFAAQLGGVLALVALTLTGLILTGVLKVTVAQSTILLASLATSAVLMGAWAFIWGRAASKPMKEVLSLAQGLSDAVGPAPFALDRGDEAARLMRHLTHVQQRHQDLARSFDQLQHEQADQRDEMEQWATDTVRLRAALDATHTDALITDEDGVILFLTKSLAVMLKEHQDKIKAVLPNVDLDRLVGQRLDAFSEAADGADLTILPTSESETELRFAGLTFNLNAQSIRGRKGGITGHVVIWRDLTSTLASGKQVAELNAELAKVKQALDLSVTPMHVVDTHGHVLYANQAFRRVVSEHAPAFRAANAQFRVDQLVGSSVGVFYSDPIGAVATLKALQAQTTQRKVLGGRTYDVTDTPIKNDEGHVLACVSQWVDCTNEWLAERALTALAERVGQGDFSKPAALDGIDGIYRHIGQQFNQIVASMGDTIAPVRAATEQLSNALASVSQSTLSLQETIEAVARQVDSQKLPKPSAVLAEKAGALLAQMLPAINHTSELLQDAMNPHASDELAATAEQLQAHASMLQAMIASYRLAVGNGRPKGVAQPQQQTDRYLAAV